MFKPIPFEAFEAFHTNFKGDNDEIFAICQKCGGQCEYDKISTLLPGEKEYMAAKLELPVVDFENRYLDSILIKGRELEALKFTPTCPFLDLNSYKCTCRDFKVVFCEIYPIIPYINDNGLLRFSLDSNCPLCQEKKYYQHFRETGIPSLTELSIPLDWYKLVISYDELSFNYSKLFALRNKPVDQKEAFPFRVVLNCEVTQPKQVIPQCNDPDRRINSCFVIMPFTEENDRLYYKFIKTTVEEMGIVCHRADEIKQPGIVTNKIVKSIIDSDMIIAEISDSNPNVFYELGVSHTFRKPTIVLARRDGKEDNIPFDIRSFEVIYYRKDRLYEMSSELKKYIEYLEDDPYCHDITINPVTNFIRDKLFYAEDMEWAWGFQRMYDEENKAKSVWGVVSSLYWELSDPVFSRLAKEGILEKKRRYLFIVPKNLKLAQQARDSFLYDLRKNGDYVNDYVKFCEADSCLFSFAMSGVVIYDGSAINRRGVILEPMAATIGEDPADVKIRRLMDSGKKMRGRLEENFFDIMIHPKKILEMATKFQVLWNELIEQEISETRDLSQKDYLRTTWILR
ncbi:MAG: hypothetical protein V1797_13500 [Pseudomonadota bacterium]